MGYADGHQRVVARDQPVHPLVELQDELAIEHVQRLLEGVHVPRQPSGWSEGADRELGVHGADLGPDQDRRARPDDVDDTTGCSANAQSTCPT